MAKSARICTPQLTILISKKRFSKQFELETIRAHRWMDGASRVVLKQVSRRIRYKIHLLFFENSRVENVNRGDNY